MKKIALVLVCMLMLFAFSACNSNSDSSSESTAGTQSATQKSTESATQKSTKPTEKPTEMATEKPTEKSTEKPTFAAKIVKGEHATSSTDSTDPTASTDAAAVDDLSVDENGVGTITGRITGKGGITFIIELPSGNKYEFSYADAEISDSENFTTGNSVTVTYTGDISGNDVGVATKIVVL